MRLFYDDYTTGRRGDLLLLAADCATILAAVLFATGAPFHAHESPWDVALLGVWAVIPRSVAKFLEWLGRPRDFLLSVSLSIAFVVAVTLLLIAGWEMLDLTMANDQPMREGTAVLVLVSWGCGFLLCHPRSYRLHDFLLAAVVLLALLQRMPAPFLWMPLFLLGIAVSASSRHLLYDVFPGAPPTRLNLQNVRALGLVFTVASLGVFALVSSLLYPLLDARVEESAMRSGHRANWFAWGRESPSASPASGWRRLFGGQDPGEPSGVDAASRRRPQSVFSLRGGVPPGDDDDGSEPRRIGFTHHVRLQDLAAPRFDSRKVLVARADAPPGSPRSTSSWTPDGGTLWRVIAFSHFDVETATWREDSEYVRGEWGEDRRHRVSEENASAWTAAIEPVWISVDVLLPVFRSLVAPYAAIELGPVDGNRTGDGSFYLLDRFESVVPYPPLEAGTRYWARVRPAPSGMRPPPRGDDESHPDARYLELPDASSTQVDLRATARVVFEGARTTREKVERLIAWLGGEFRRSTSTTWRGNGDHLRKFLVDERVGDCTYFSTASAFLLRAAGVSTRLAVGFVGCEPEANGAYVVRNRNAHAWIEVWASPHGWYPLDPTTWAAPDPGDPGSLAAPTAGSESFRFDSPAVADASRALSAGGARDDESEDPDDELDAGGAPREPLGPWRGREPGDTPVDTAVDTADDTADDGAGGFAGLFPDGLFGAASGSGRGPREPASGEPASGDAAGSADAASPTAPGESSRLLRTALVRTVLAVLGAAAALLAVIAYLRPRRKHDETETLDADGVGAPATLGDAADPPWLRAPVDEREAVLFEYQRLQADLARTRSHRLAHQTPVEHGQRFRGRDAELEGAFGLLHRILYAVLYGRRRARDADVDEARKQCRVIRRHLA